MKSLVIIPAYNEALNIEKLINELSVYNYDYLVINDCSKDNTEEILINNNYNHLNLTLNVGLAGVTKIGFKYAYDYNYDAAITIDGDGQHDPKYIKDIFNEIENGSDYVVGSRFVSDKKDNSLRMLGSRILCFFIKLKTGRSVTDPTSGMRALNRKVLEDFSHGMNFIAEPDAMCYCIHHGYKVKEIQVKMRDREAGESYFKNPLKTVGFMFNVIISILFIQW